MNSGFSSRNATLNLALLLASLLAGFLILKVSVGYLEVGRTPPLESITGLDEEEIRRIVTETSPGIYRPTSDPSVGYLLQPHLDKEAFRSRIRTSGAGLRGATIEAKASGVKRIVCLGDSHTFGYKVDEEDAYPSQLEEILDDADPGMFEVLNCAVPSWNIQAEAAWLRARLSFLDPDFVIWQIYDNDLWATFGVADSGFATMEFSPQEREKGQSYYTAPSEIYCSSLRARIERAALEIRDVADLLASQDISLLLYFISDKDPGLANFLHGFAPLIGDIPTLIHPDRYETDAYRLGWDPHFNPEGNRMLALGAAWALRERLGLAEKDLPPQPEGFEFAAPLSELAGRVDVEELRNRAWGKAPTRIAPSDPESLRHSIGLLKIGWVCQEFETLIQTPGPGRIEVEGEFLAYPQITPLKLEFSVGDATQSITLHDKGPFTLTLDLPHPRSTEEGRYGGTLLQCRADKYCSTLYDHRMLSWVLKEIRFVPVSITSP